MRITEHGIAGTYNHYGYIYNNIKVTRDNTIAKPPQSIRESFTINEIPEGLRGGVIVFSTDVNAKTQSKNKIIDFVKKKAKTIYNRFAHTKKIDKITKKFTSTDDDGNVNYDIQGWTIGRFFNGRYRAKDGSVFDENSLSVELLYVPTDTLLRVAEELCDTFDQESVLVKDYANNKIYFVDNEVDESLKESYNIPVIQDIMSNNDFDYKTAERRGYDNEWLEQRIWENICEAFLYLKTDESRGKIMDIIFEKECERLGINLED